MRHPADSPPPVPAEPAVDVIVPVYRGLAETRRCVESVLAARQAIPFELVLVDDRGPEPEVGAYLAALAGRPGITLLVNGENLGFVASVNRAMALHPARDVVLLNSDTEVANDWLDRLRRCARSAADIGTATPFSNNASICSYPDFLADNPLPEGMALAGLDAVFSRANAGRVADLPTAVGFCMYIRRDCLDGVGLFDAGRFGRGYGEENDFSRRAAGAGWRNVLCADLFVWHQGGASFGAEREGLLATSAETMRRLHPDYPSLVRRFVLEDPLAEFRRAVDIELAVRRREGEAAAGPATGPGRPVQLHVAHGLGGGAERWLRDYCAADWARSNLVLRPWSPGPGYGGGLALYDGADAVQPLRFWAFAAPFAATAVGHPEYRRALTEIVRDYGVDAVLVSSLLGHALDALDTGLPTVQVLHDYYPFCPAINLHFGGVCQSCDAARLAECAAGNPDFNPPFLDFPAEDRLRVRTRYRELVAAGRITLAAPGRAARDHLLRLAPDLGRAGWVVLPHGYGDPPPPARRRDNPDGRLRVLVLGMLAPSKGMHLLEEGLDRLAEFADLHLLGAGEVGELFRDRPHVRVVPRYTAAELPGLVAGIQPDVGLLLSIWPETYSYTLSELILLGIPPVATRLGSFAERIRPGETGYLFEPDATAMLAQLRAIDADRATLAAVRATLPRARPRPAAAMVADYHRLLPVPAPRDAAPAAGPGSGEADATGIARALELARLGRQLRSRDLLLDMKEARIRALRREAGARAGRMAAAEAEAARLAEELAAARADLRQRDEGLAAMRASTSWRLSRPVRWVGTGWRKARTLARCLAPLAGRPAAAPAALAGLVRAWRDGGMTELRRALADLRDGPAAAAPEPAMEAPDWRQPLFRHYRASLDEAMRGAIRARVDALPSLPRITVLLATYDTPERMLDEALRSVEAQLYPNWELCVADDGSTQSQARRLLEDFAARDPRVRLHFGAENRGVSHALNRALELATGEFAVLMDHDDMLEPQALFRVAEAILEDDPDMLYSDEVQVMEDGERAQYFTFRPAFSPAYLRAHPYIVHLAGFRLDLLRRLGGFDEGLRISQDYDLILRASEQAARIVHIPEILYRWRILGYSAGHRMIGQVMETSRAVLRRHLERQGEAGEVFEGASFNYFDVRHPLRPGLKVAVIIPTRNQAELVRQCIDSIRRTVSGIDYDIVLVDHQSDEPAALDYFARPGPQVRVLRYEGPFSFAAINNWAARRLDDRYSHILFCNNDIEALAPGWLERMLELGQQPDVGVVGAKLYYPDRHTLQHAGVCLGAFGLAENLGRGVAIRDEQADIGYHGAWIAPREVSAVTAACLLIDRPLFDELGGFDEEIAVLFGDVDLCLRVWERGRRVLFCPQARLVHHESMTRGKDSAGDYPDDGPRFLAKWAEFLAGGDPFHNPNLSLASTNWEIRAPLEFRLDIRRRVMERLPGGGWRRRVSGGSG